MRKTTSLVELVETHNIMLSLNRIKKHNSSWRLALWHAFLMSECDYSFEMRKKLRETLGLP